ncbi:MAG: hypothetical protein WCC60_12950 [Ilumatobacteraceae bacterium]
MTDPAEPTFAPFLPPRAPSAAPPPTLSVLPPLPPAGPSAHSLPATGSAMRPPMGSMLSAELIDVAPAVRPAKRRRWVAVAAVTGVVALGAGAAAVVMGGGHKAEAGYSLTSAAASAESAQNVGYEMTMAIGTTTVNATGRLDVAHGLLAMDMTLPMDDAKVGAILDLNNATIYMETSAFADQGVSVPADWVSLDAGELPGVGDMLQQSASTNPLDVAQVFDHAKEVVDAGVEDFRGEQVKHYSVTVVTADALAAYPALQQQIAQMGSEFPAEMHYEVYVTADSQLRRVVYAMPVAGETVSADIVFTAVGTIEPIVLPAPEDVIDFSSMINSLSAG